MKYDIYFHNDFDGRASAAVMLAFLQSRGDDIERFRSVTYGKEAKWYKMDYFTKGNPAIVVDFAYHPNATWWFDHHSTTFKEEKWGKDWGASFKPDKQRRLETHHPSACGLVYASLRRDFKWKAPKHLAEFVRIADKIDGAGYKTAKETLDMHDAGIEMNAYIEALDHTAKEDEHMIRLMAAKPLEKVLKDPSIARAVASLKKKVARSMAFYRKQLRVMGRLSFIDLTPDPLNGLLRYAPYYLYPKIVYNIRMKRKGTKWYLGVAANPWRRAENKIDIGALMKRYGGGGHHSVGATEFSTRAKALAAFGEIAMLVNQ